MGILRTSGSKTFRVLAHSALLAVISMGVVLDLPPVTAKTPATTTQHKSTGKTVTVTEANNNKSVTLHPGDTLLVRLESNPSTGFSWSAVVDPGFPLHLWQSVYVPKPHRPRVVGVGGMEEFRFTVPASYNLEGASLGAWQRMLYLRPFAPGIKDATLWQIHVILEPKG